MPQQCFRTVRVTSRDGTAEGRPATYSICIDTSAACKKQLKDLKIALFCSPVQWRRNTAA
eukprot:4919755-Prymnesium_polylepis.2